MKANSQFNDLRGLRLLLGLRQKDVAARARCSITLISFLERGIRRHPRSVRKVTEVLFALAQKDTRAQ